jgi:cephalosporin hydroxylase
MESQPSTSSIPWRGLFCIQSLLIVLLFTHYQYSQRTPRFWNNATNKSVVVVKTSTPDPNYNSTGECCSTQKLLEKCSTSEFVTLRAKKRIAADKNAIFVQGDRVINLGDNYFISVDDILFGYDILFEVDILFSAGQWLGANFQSSPPDAMVLQQLIWKIKPDLIIDFGTNAGGSAIFFASIMSLYSDTGLVLTVDVLPFTENRVHPNSMRCKDCVNPSENKLWKKYVQFIQGSTTDGNVIAKIKETAAKYTKVFFSHDSSHDAHIVYQDLINYAHLVSVGSYLVVQDTKMDRLKYGTYNGPLTAIRQFLDYQNKTTNRANYTFEVDRSVEIFYYTQHANGWLKRIQ